MSKKGTASFRLLTGSMLLSILFLSVIAMSREPGVDAMPAPMTRSLFDISGYCAYRPDWPLFQAGDEVVQQSTSGIKDVYQILLPRVDRPVTIYDKQDHKIPLKRGDVVTVDACGCVQTGGKGNETWKHYVNPSGDNSDRLYHGVILMPNAAALGLQFSPHMKNFVRISDLMAWQRRGPNNRLRVTENTYLTLGYEDDDNKDNGYWGHDNGNNDQCKNVGGAAVEIAIEHH